MLTLEQRDYQTRIIQRTLDAVVEGHRSVLIESPVGSGKTVMGHLIAQALHERYGWTTGWTAMRRHLLVQAQEDNHRFINFPHIKYFSVFDADPPTDIDVLIEDEGHHSASATSTGLYQKLKPKLHLALSGTPYRCDKLKLCFSKVIRDAGIRALIDAGYLAPYHQYLFDQAWTPGSVSEVYLQDRARWGKSVIYFLDLIQCHTCAAILEGEGVRCEVVHGGSDQEGQIAAFAKDEIDVLLNVFVLSEGFNQPRLRTVFVRPGSKGPTIQMAGRVLRQHPDKPFAQIVQSSHTPWPFSKVASPQARFVLTDDRWMQRGTLSHRIASASANSLIAISGTPIVMPPYLRGRLPLRRDRVIAPPDAA